MKPLHSYIADAWIAPEAPFTDIASAVTGESVARIGTTVRDFGAVLSHARKVGGPALRAMTFPKRAAILKALGDAIMANKDALYEISAETGATKSDGWIDIEGGAATLFAYASKGRRELPNDTILLDGAPEGLSKRGTFMGQHVMTPLQGAAVHINAFNFPVWGMLEKLGPALLAGVPCIVKPASASAQLTEAAFRILIETGALPKGALQLIIGPTGDLFDHLTGQDVVSFTGSADTAAKLQRHPVIARESVRFIAERDSLNAAVLASSARRSGIRSLHRRSRARNDGESGAEMHRDPPRLRAGRTHGRGRSRTQDGARGRGDRRTREPRATRRRARQDRRTRARGPHRPWRSEQGVRQGRLYGADPAALRRARPRHAVHEVEAFGPVATLMPYRDIDDAVTLVNRGQGSLVMSLYTHDPAVARKVLTGSGAFHGRLLVLDRDCAKESTGHGSPLPALIHGGPGRAAAARRWAACAAYSTTCSGPRCRRARAC